MPEQLIGSLGVPLTPAGSGDSFLQGPAPQPPSTQIRKEDLLNQTIAGDGGMLQAAFKSNQLQPRAFAAHNWGPPPEYDASLYYTPPPYNSPPPYDPPPYDSSPDYSPQQPIDAGAAALGNTEESGDANRARSFGHRLANLLRPTSLVLQENDHPSKSASKRYHNSPILTAMENILGYTVDVKELAKMKKNLEVYDNIGTSYKLMFAVLGNSVFRNAYNASAVVGRVPMVLLQALSPTSNSKRLSIASAIDTAVTSIGFVVGSAVKGVVFGAALVTLTAAKALTVLSHAAFAIGKAVLEAVIDKVEPTFAERNPKSVETKLVERLSSVERFSLVERLLDTNTSPLIRIARTASNQAIDEMVTDIKHRLADRDDFDETLDFYFYGQGAQIIADATQHNVDDEVRAGVLVRLLAEKRDLLSSRASQLGLSEESAEDKTSQEISINNLDVIKLARELLRKLINNYDE